MAWSHIEKKSTIHAHIHNQVFDTHVCILADGATYGGMRSPEVKGDAFRKPGVNF